MKNKTDIINRIKEHKVEQQISGFDEYHDLASKIDELEWVLNRGD